MKKKMTVWITIIVVILVCFTWHSSVMAQNENEQELSMEYYRELEDLYTTNLTEKLTGMGYKNAGVSTTRVYKEDGSFEYTALIHHKKIEKMNEEEKKALLKELSIIHLQAKDCVFKEEFLDS